MFLLNLSRGRESSPSVRSALEFQELLGALAIQQEKLLRRADEEPKVNLPVSKYGKHPVHIPVLQYFLVMIHDIVFLKCHCAS